MSKEELENLELGELIDKLISVDLELINLNMKKEEDKFQYFERIKEQVNYKKDIIDVLDKLGIRYKRSKGIL